MPTVSTFYGILIRLFFKDHTPPHFHARYGEFEATIDIGTLAVMQGQLPGRALNLVQAMGDATWRGTARRLAALPRESTPGEDCAVAVSEIQCDVLGCS